jgi:hypothetical protein
MLADTVVLNFALQLGYFFMLRASEFLLQPGRPWSEGRVVQGRNIDMRKGDERVFNFTEAEELVNEITGYKTD